MKPELTPTQQSADDGRGQSTPHTLGVEVRGVDCRAGLLPPGLIQPSSVDAVKAQFINELEDTQEKAPGLLNPKPNLVREPAPCPS